MEWLLLCLLVPAVVVPVVLLWGFAGCDLVFPSQADPPKGPPAAPVVTATPIATDATKVEWVDSNTRPMRFEVHRAKDGDPFELLATVDNAFAFVDPTDDPGLAPLELGVTYNYQVFGSFQDEPDNQSHGSNIVVARPLAFAADLSVTQQIPIPPSNYTFVLRISPARLRNSGTKVRLTLQGAPSGNVIITGIFLSLAGPTGDDYDSLPAGNPGGLTQVGSALVLADDQPKALEWVDYPLDPSQDLIVAFDFTATASQDNIRYDPSPGVALHFGPGFQEAGVADRTSGYAPQAGPRSYLVKQIEVL
jgi:hypothetical protein